MTKKLALAALAALMLGLGSAHAAQGDVQIQTVKVAGSTFASHLPY